MEFQQVYLSEQAKWQTALNQSQLIWPFAASHSAARAQMIANIRQGAVYHVRGKTILEEFFIQFTLEANQLRVENLLVLNCHSQKQVLQLVEQICRRFFKAQLVLNFPQEVNFQQRLFLDQGYQMIENKPTKAMYYKNGLVFGGGGSHGAYQIGVWLALEESQIPIHVVTGASVGALNGALFVQGDLDVAKELWQKLSTEQVMSFPKAAEKPEDLGGLMQQVASLTTHALVNRGVSTAPLQEILASRLSREKMQQSQTAFYFTVTRIRGMKEMAISYQPEFQENWLAWLMASASFFPAMALQEIDGEYYMDGGYRNNIPVDLAYDCGVTDCFMVDIQGPGLTKNVKKPAGVNLIPLHSPWSLGSFLLFSPQRSQENLTLGYLETRKALGQLKGNWYSFYADENLEQDWPVFWKQLQTRIGKKYLSGHDFIDKLRKYYSDRVVWEQCGQIFSELAGKYTGVTPKAIYRYQQFKETISEELAQATISVNDLSISEWLDKYYQDSPLSDNTQMKKRYDSLRQLSPEAFSKQLQEAYRKAPVSTVFVAYLIYLERGAL